MRTNRLALVTIMLGTIMNVMIVDAQPRLVPDPVLPHPRVDAGARGQCARAGGRAFRSLQRDHRRLGAVVSSAKRGRDDGPVLVMGLQCVAWAVFGTAKSLAPTPQLALAGHVMTSLFATWAVTSALTALNQITPNRLRGQVVAVYTLLTAFVGVALGSVAVGVLNDHVFTDPKGVAPSLALVCFTGGLTGIALLSYGRGAYLAAVTRGRGFVDAT